MESLNKSLPASNDTPTTKKFLAVQGATSGTEANANNMSGLEKSSRSQLSSPSQNYYSDDDFDLYPHPPRGKRLAPVGAASNEDEISNVMAAYSNDGQFNLENSTSDNNQLEERLKQMEEDQEELNNSLMSLTSHFAKVQLRLQQVVGAAPENREDLLKELEQFAFRGIPNLSSPRIPEQHQVQPQLQSDCKEAQGDFCETLQAAKEDKQGSGSDETDALLESQRKRQTELIHQLKGQLEELESYAYESGEGSMPSNVLLERQRVVMEQLKARLNLNVDNIDKLTEDELKAQVDSAVGQIVNPLKMKSQLVDQLQTQITDLEMFIDFLQGEASTILPGECNGCGCSKHNSPTKSPLNGSSCSKDQGRHKGHHHHKHVPRYRMRTASEQDEIRKQTTSILEKTLAVLQLTALAQFGCGSENFHKNSLKQTKKGNHYGDLRARLELAVDHILEACSRVECLTDTDCTTTASNTSLAASEESSSSHSQPEFLMNSPLVTTIVRRELAVAIRDLMQHGMVSAGGRSSIIPFMGCMSSKAGQNRASASATTSGTLIHAWDVIMKYYRMKGGPEFNAAPARKLSMSFGLDLSGTAANNRQALLGVINQVLLTHEPYKRSQDAMFKAFICAGLNKRKLIPWLKLILRNQTIMETFYTNWSYVAKTGFDDAFRAIERLSMYVFDLPVDVAIKQFKDMNEAF